MYFVYFAKSLRNQKVYVGFTGKEPVVRVDEHNKGSNIWSKNNGPFKLIYFESYICKKDAQNREEFYKMGFGKQIKLAIIKELNLA